MSDTYQAVYDATRTKLGNCDVGSAVTEAIRQAFDISYTIPVVAQEISLAAQRCYVEIARPSAVYRPAISIDGNQWCALYGTNIMQGVCGYGDTPADAMADFDKNWTTQKAVPA